LKTVPTPGAHFCALPKGGLYQLHAKDYRFGGAILEPPAMARILLAEDDDSLRAFLVTNLNRAGHQVEAHGDGDSAWEALERGAYDLLLTDIVMPGLDGIELARRGAEADPAMKIVFITGFAAVALSPQSQAPKDAKVLSKPFHLKDLVAEVERVIAAA
jgi:two-component system, cell cycle response regulator CpdR